MSLKSDLERFREQATHKDALLRDLKRDNLEMLTLKKELDESRKNSSQKIADLQKQLSTAYEETKELRLKQKELKKQLDQKDAENDQVHLALESLNNRSDKDTDQYRSELERLSQQLRTAQDSLLKEKSQSSKLKTDSESLSQTNRRLTDKLATLSSENSGLKNRLMELEALVESRITETNHSLRHLANCQTTAKKPQAAKDELLASVSGIVNEYKAQLAKDK